MEFLLEGIMSVTWQQILMYLVGIILIWLAIKKEYEPALLLPMGFGAILVNLPNTGVINQVLSGVGDTNGIIEWLFHVGIEASEALPHPSVHRNRSHDRFWSSAVPAGDVLIWCGGSAGNFHCNLCGSTSWI